MIRVFIAISLPEENQRLLEQAIRPLRQMGLNGRFPDPASIHLTLKFLGDIEESRIEPASTILDKCCRVRSPFSIRLEGIAAFPHSANPRVLWMGVGPVPELSDLQREIEEQMNDLGFEPEERAFKPHLTVARIKGRRNIESLIRFLQTDKDNPAAGSFRVDSVDLYKSVLKSTGAEYSLLHRASLSKEDLLDERE